MPQTGHRYLEAIELFAGVLGQMEQEAPTSAFYGRLCRSVCELVSVDRAIMLLYDADLRRVRPAGAHAIDVGAFTDAYVHVDTAHAARAALQENRVQQVDGNTLLGELPEVFHPIVRDRRILWVPVSTKGNWAGVLLVDRSLEAPPVDEEDLELLWTLGKAIALATTARNATRQAERARQLQQRIDLAREIHDGVIQRLFGVSLALAASEGELGAEERARCAEEVQEALTDLRATIQRPLGREAADPALAEFHAEVGRLAAAHADITIMLDEGAPRDLPRELDALAQSVLAESVRNARKHAAPTLVAVRTRVAGSAFVLEIENDGVAGMPPLRTPGVGLRLVAFEALQRGGVLEFGPRGDDRWQVRLAVPLPDA